MVSLNRNFNTSTGGGLFFGDSSLNDDDTQRLQPVLGVADDKTFTPLKTVPAVVLQLLSAVGVLIAAVVLAVAYPEELDRCAPFFIIIYIHAAFWCISLIVDTHVKQNHHKLRVLGYLEFYRQTRDHSRVPFYIVSLWNAVLLVLTTVLHHIYEDFKEQCIAAGFKKPVYYLCIAIGVETLLLIWAIASYISKVVCFNKSKPPPDVLREEWMSSFIQDSYSAGEVGYRDRDDHIDEILEKQADLIRYLLDRNTKLSQKIMVLSSRLSERRS